MGESGGIVALAGGLHGLFSDINGVKGTYVSVVGSLVGRDGGKDPIGLGCLSMCQRSSDKSRAGEGCG
jgi:hypothetical protein